MLKKKNVVGDRGWLVMFFYIAIILLLALRNINSLSSIVVINDEFGYWGIAAQLAGYDWSDLLSTTPYYSYGYSLLLVPLFWLKLTAETMYRVAIIMNALFLVGSYFLCVFCGRKLFSSFSKVSIYFVSFIVILYTNTIFQAQIAWSETLLYFLFWLIFALAIYIIESPGIYSIGLFALNNVYIYMVHQRSVGVVISSVIFISILAWTKIIDRQKILFFVICIISLLSIHGLIKNYTINNFFTDIKMVSMNNYSGQVDKLAILFGSKNGFFNFIQSICGKLYYLGAATFLIGYTSAMESLRQTIACLKKILKNKFDEDFKTQVVGLFLFFSFGATFLISAIAMNYSTSRLDVLIYGRYMEFAIGPVLLYGILYFILLDKPYLTILIEEIILLFLSIVINNSFLNTNAVWFNSYCATTLNYFFENKLQVPYLTYWITVICIIIPCLITVLVNQVWIKKNITRHCLFTCIILAISWVFFSGNPIFIKAQGYVRTSTEEIIQPIQELAGDYSIYFLYDKQKEPENYYAELKYAQYKLYEKQIKMVSDLNEIDCGLSEKSYIITLNDNNIAEDLEDGYSLIKQSDCLSLYALEDSVLEQSYKHYMQKVRYNVLENMILRDKRITTESDYIIIGPYISLPRADYEVFFELKQITGDSNLGFCDISANNGATILNTVPLEEGLFEEGKAIIKIPFSLYETTDKIEFRIYTNAGVNLVLEDIYYTQKLESFTLGLDDSTEFTKLVEDICTMNFTQSIAYMNSTEDDINLEYLQGLLPNYKVFVSTMDKLLDFSEFTYVIADRNCYDWMSLLPEYVVLAQYNNHLLLVSAEVTSADINALSVGEYGELKLIQKKQENSFVAQTYCLQEGGKYEVRLMLPDTENTENIHIEILSGKSVIDECDVISSEKTVDIPLESYFPIKDLSFILYKGEDAVQTQYKSGFIRRIRNQTSYMYTMQLDPLITLADKIETSIPISLLYMRWTKGEKREITQYFGGRDVELLKYNEASIADCKESSCMIVPADVSLIFELLPDFVVVNRTRDYVLLFNKKSLTQLHISKKEILSENMTLKKEFFELVDEKGIKKLDIFVPQGTYEVEMDLEMGYSDEVNEKNGMGYLRIWNDKKLYKTCLITDKENSFIFSTTTGINRLYYDILEGYPGIIRGQMVGIKKVSDDYWVDLGRMYYFNGIYNELTDTITTTDDIIYGPYVFLESGEYIVTYIYESNMPQDIEFDVITDGIVLCDSTDIRYSDNNYRSEIMLPVSIESNLSDVEFRVHIPQGNQCTLRAIKVSKSNE